jgi:taurine--2-oxoglutarate transaminase
MQLNEVIDAEGGHTIAAIFVEAVTGTNGVLPSPKGYLEGLRALCDQHGILLVCDEVMSGFGRTGKLFGFCHAPTVIPDIVTFAKGVNGAYLPLGGVGIRDHVAAHFRANNVGIGSTYNSHPVALASAYAALQVCAFGKEEFFLSRIYLKKKKKKIAAISGQVFFENDVLGNVQRLEPKMKAHLTHLLNTHPSVKQARCIGLFGCLDLQKNDKGDFLGKVTEPTPALMGLKKSLLDKGEWSANLPHFGSSLRLNFARRSFHDDARPQRVLQSTACHFGEGGARELFS